MARFRVSIWFPKYRVFHVFPFDLNLQQPCFHTAAQSTMAKKCNVTIFETLYHHDITTGDVAPMMVASALDEVDRVV